MGIDKGKGKGKARPGARKGDESDSDGEGAGSSCLATKFPRTRHMLDLGGVSRDDLLMDAREVDAFLAAARDAGGLVAEEKIDGANLGISMDPTTYQLRFQNRSHLVTSECLCFQTSL